MILINASLKLKEIQMKSRSIMKNLSMLKAWMRKSLERSGIILGQISLS